MEPHQERVVREKAELDDKIDKLSEFVGKSVFGGLSDEDRLLLTRQLSVMKDYSRILKARISRF